MHRAALPTKNYPAQRVRSAQPEKCCLWLFCSLLNKVTSSFDTNICIKFCSKKFLNWFAAQKNCQNNGPSYLFLQTPHKSPSVISLLCLHLTAYCSINATHPCVPQWPVRPGSRDVLHLWLQVLLGGAGFGLRRHASVSLADSAHWARV